MNYAYSHGRLVVACTGNKFGNYGFYPSVLSLDFSNVIAVGATDYDDYRGWYSNYGSHLNVVAPGGIMSDEYHFHEPEEKIYSTLPIEHLI